MCWVLAFQVVAELCFASSLKFLQPSVMVMDSTQKKPVNVPTFDEEGSTPWEHITNLLQLGTGQRALPLNEGQRDSWKVLTPANPNPYKKVYTSCRHIFSGQSRIYCRPQAGRAQLLTLCADRPSLVTTQARRERERILARHGIIDWQSNVYYIAGRVLVSSLMETYGATQWMFNDGLMQVRAEPVAVARLDLRVWTGECHHATPPIPRARAWVASLRQLHSLLSLSLSLSLSHTHALSHSRCLILQEVTNELIGDGPERGGTLLRQISVPEAFVGYRYRQLFRYLVIKRKVVPLGLFRCKPSGNYDSTAKRLKYVHCNPDGMTILENTDRVFVVRERNGAWMDNYG
jgi:hypothetical protein